MCEEAPLSVYHVSSLKNSPGVVTKLRGCKFFFFCNLMIRFDGRVTKSMKSYPLVKLQTWSLV